MAVITVANIKGGVGKSTLALHLAVALQHEGRAVTVIDLDNAQLNPSRGFIARRSERLNGSAGEPIRALTLDFNPHADMAQLFEDLVSGEQASGRSIIVDCPAAGGPCLNRALDISTLLITPMNESLADLEAIQAAGGELGALTRRVRGARSRRHDAGAPPLHWRVVLNRVSPLSSRNAHVVGDRLRALASRWDFEIAGAITERVLYRQLFDDGLTLLDLFRSGVDTPPLSAITARNELRDLVRKLGLDAINSN